MVKEIVRPAMILFLVCAIVTGALAYVYNMTKPVIDERNLADKQVSLRKVMPQATTFTEGETAETLTEKGMDVPETVTAVYRAQAGGEPAGFVIEVSSRGYSSDVKLLVGIAADGKLQNIAVLSHSETPGLGSKAADPAYLKQFEGLQASLGLKLVKNGQKAADTDIEAVSGATITSRAVIRGVQDAMTMAQILAKEAG